VSPGGSADNVFIHILPGQTYHYSYQFPNTLKPDTYWYHSHAHPIAAPQVAGGTSGIIIVDGSRQYLPPALRDITEHVLALKDFQVQGNAVKTTDLKIGAPTTRTTNGQLNRTGGSPETLASQILDNTGVTYIVVADSQGIRFSHPNPALIGKRVSTPPTPVATGGDWVGIQTGTLGRSARGKAPIFDDAHQVIG
jgi:FtsP/CotA-like multicopper oxidase with cupredoxin domain